jgi:hypothetical protein
LCLPEVTGLVKPILFLEMTLQIEQSSQSSGRFIAFGVLGATRLWWLKTLFGKSMILAMPSKTIMDFQELIKVLKSE